MHELLYAAAPAAVGAWYGTRSWMARRTLGHVAPDFELSGTDGRRHALSAIAADVVVLLFMSNRCPGVKAYDGRLRRLMQRHGERVAWLGINPIDEGLYPGEGLEGMRTAVKDRGLTLLYLKDPDQQVARAYGAICTPEVVVLDSARRIRYRGRIDDSLVEANARQAFLDDAVTSLLAGRAPRVRHTAPLGCSIDAAAANAIVRSKPRPRWSLART
jgi:peroxiredoxin